MRRLFPAAVAVIAALALSGCGERAAGEPPPRLVTDDAHGLAFELPAHWQVAAESLTPGLTDPRELLSVGTFPMSYRKTGCAHLASSAFADLGPGDAFVTLLERGINPEASWIDFPARPDRFGPELGARSEAAECVPSARFTDHWFGFTDGGRHFHVDVAFGPDASDAVRREAWTILDNLRIDPAVKPDWRSCC